MAEGWSVEKINTSPQNFKNNINSRLFSRIRLFMSIWVYLMQANLSGKIVYLALSGGWGQIYDAITVLLSRLVGASCVLHHHSFAYLEKKSSLSAFLFRLAGGGATHVVLCESMKAKLQKKYGTRLVLILPNLALLQPDELNKNRSNVKTIGYLSNITREKGGRDFIRLAEAIQERGWPIKCRIAGPCQDLILIRELQEAHEQGFLEWVGPLYGGQKNEFWNSIDLFVFPTKYENEAEPLVVWEALLFENPVIAYDRGCISAQVGGAGKMISNDEDFVISAMKQIELWQVDPQVYRDCVQEAIKLKKTAKAKAEKQWKEFIFNLQGKLTNNV